ncbi:unnamed protein product [Ostreobium quekettii]|uniref:Uncharacterized protein n=1 Tax=Ostreobium quekettii TaxID=121088 RepID=A0A8S1J2M3_9CHLO|nr:unnamed protein product [Ostreobium quekettii]|eukprot:evm.model.scf_1241.1 EVM.evm.TU.scf_1241.1   scf_1241:20066-20560(-)
MRDSGFGSSDGQALVSVRDCATRNGRDMTLEAGARRGRTVFFLNGQIRWKRCVGRYPRVCVGVELNERPVCATELGTLGGFNKENRWWWLVWKCVIVFAVGIREQKIDAGGMCSVSALLPAVVLGGQRVLQGLDQKLGRMSGRSGSDGGGNSLDCLPERLTTPL